MNTKKPILVLNLTLLLLFGYLLVDLAYAVLTKDQASGSKTSAGFSSPAVVTRRRENYPYARYQVIEKRDIFSASIGAPLAFSKNVPSEPVNLPKTPLKLVLRGTIIKGDVSFAIISNVKTRKEELFKVGDTIEGARLVAIYKKSVVLESNGREEVLQLIDTDKAVELKKQPAQQPAQQAVARPGYHSSDAQVVSTRDVQYLKDNANKLLNQVRIIPYFSEGVSRGYRLASIQPGSLIEKYGFKKGDVLMSVNGISLESPEKALQAYSVLQGAGNVQITVERGGSPVTLSFTVGD